MSAEGCASSHRVHRSGGSDFGRIATPALSSRRHTRQPLGDRPDRPALSAAAISVCCSAGSISAEAAATRERLVGIDRLLARLEESCLAAERALLFLGMPVTGVSQRDVANMRMLQAVAIRYLRKLETDDDGDE